MHARKTETGELLTNSSLLHLGHSLDRLYLLRDINNLKISFEVTVPSANPHQKEENKPEEVLSWSNNGKAQKIGEERGAKKFAALGDQKQW